MVLPNPGQTFSLAGLIVICYFYCVLFQGFKMMARVLGDDKHWAYGVANWGII